jgi:hypothetical protein
MARKSTKENSPVLAVTPEQFQLLLEKMSAMAKNLETLQDKLDSGETTGIPDKVKRQLDMTDPRLQRQLDKEIRSSKKTIEGDMVDWIPSRTDVVCVEGNRYSFTQGVPIRVPRIVVAIVGDSDRQMVRVEALSQKLQKSLEIEEATKYAE